MIAGLITRALRPEDCDFARRGFVLDRPASRAHLEQRAEVFIAGARAYAADPASGLATMAPTPPGLRGFAFEGAGLSAYLLDVGSAGRGHHLRGLLAGAGHDYRHLVHVGAGWGMGRLRAPVPWLAPSLDPLLRWLGLDGVGFQQMFFRPGPTLAHLRRVGPRDLSDRSLVRTTGHGRALWFVQAGDIDRVGAVVEDLPEPVRSALWAGVGLAAAYAGLPDGVDAAALRATAGASAADAGQGIVFGAVAHATHGDVPPATASLLRDYCSVTPAIAVGWADDAAAQARTRGVGVGAYQLWRRLLRDRVGATLQGTVRA